MVIPRNFKNTCNGVLLSMIKACIYNENTFAVGYFSGDLQKIKKSFPYQNGLSFTNEICGFLFKRSVQISKVRDHPFSSYAHISEKLTFFTP